MSVGSSIASCLRAVLMHHVWGQFLCIMSEVYVWGQFFGTMSQGSCLYFNKITNEMNSCLRAVLWDHGRRQFFLDLEKLYGACLRAVLWDHVRGQFFLDLEKTLRSMSEGSSLRSCQRAVLSELRKNATEHVWGQFFMCKKIESQLTDDLSKLTRTNLPIKKAESQ